MTFRLKESLAKWQTVVDSNKRYREAGRLYEAAIHGDPSARNRLLEAISEDNLAGFLTPAVVTQMLRKYDEFPTVWTSFATEAQVPESGKIGQGEFYINDEDKTPSRDGRDHIPGGLSPVGEYDEYPALNFEWEESDKELAKAGNRVRLSFEAMRKSRSFGLLDQFTTDFARRAATEEEYQATSQLARGGAVNGDNFNGSIGNLLAGNPELTLEALDQAKQHVRTKLYKGSPVTVTRFILVVPPALSTYAKRLVTIPSIQVTDSNGTYDLPAGELHSDIRVVENPYLAMDEFAGTSGGDKFWWLLPDPAVEVRPTIQNVFMEGYREPLISIKSQDHRSIGGGEVPWESGAFLDDSIQTRVRHIVTGHAWDTGLVQAVFSNGTKS